MWVVNPIDGSFVEAAAIDSVMQGMTEYQWKVLKRAVRERFDKPEHLLSLAAGRNAIRELVEEALKKPSRRRRSGVMRYLEGGSSLTEDRGECTAGHATVGGGLNQDDPSVSAMPSADEQRQASPAVPIDSDDIDVSDWEVASPDV